jgi:hypothetical protein
MFINIDKDRAIGFYDIEDISEEGCIGCIPIGEELYQQLLQMPIVRLKEEVEFKVENLKIENFIPVVFEPIPIEKTQIQKDLEIANTKIEELIKAVEALTNIN